MLSICYSAKLNNSEGNKEKISLGDLFLILKLVFEYVNSSF